MASQMEWVNRMFETQKQEADKKEAAQKRRFELLIERMKTLTDNRRNYQEKFEFFIISLIFTVLGLSIQTTSFPKSILVRNFEYIAWGSLIFSGILAIFRLYKYQSFFAALREATGEMEPIAKKEKTAVAKNKKRILEILLFIQLALMIIGFISLVLARGVFKTEIPEKNPIYHIILDSRQVTF